MDRMTTNALAMSLADRTPKRHRHTVRLRHLKVARVEQLSHALVRVIMAGPELSGFSSLGFDDHVKMFFAAPGEAKPRLPTVGPNGLEMPEDGPPLLGRDYTPRSFDPETGELAIDFAIHHDGPASNWARAAKPGQSAWVAGPRGSFVVPLTFDWHLLIADETGLPALARRLEELPAGTRALALIEVEGQDDVIPLQTASDASIVWVHRHGSDPNQTGPLLEALTRTALPSGDFFGWIGCESSTAKALRSFLVTERGANPKWLRASGYWRRGDAGVHDHFDD
ncbi:FAD-binding protein [Rhizobium sp. AAP43]|nr:FAD-binding protein [Rhizobium sp. AAP43]